jgi:hypothetical protein
MARLRHNYVALNISGARAGPLSLICMGAGVACSSARSSREAPSPRNGRHPHSRCNWPKLVAWGPCALDATFHSSRALASLWFPQTALMYSITTSVQLNFPLAVVPPHLLLAGPSTLDVSRSLKESWLARPGQTPISRETLVELFERDSLRTSLTGAFPWPISS